MRDALKGGLCGGSLFRIVWQTVLRRLSAEGFAVVGFPSFSCKMATRNREPQKCSRSRTGRYLPGSLYSNYISTRFLGFPVLGGSHFLPFNFETPREQEELEKEDDADFREAIVEPGIVCQVFLNPKGR